MRRKITPPPKLVRLSSLVRLAYFSVNGKAEISENHALLPNEFYQVTTKRARNGTGMMVSIASQTKRISPTITSVPVFFVPIERAREIDVQELRGK